ncbi:protein of unknown function DUF6 transmembrane [Paenibacillus curdlanolyticus YK9]|uniref:EamA domain-containing protein n=1 Tax=Paenibacillus curdlanolyticus YK9 TaxID=717606 RepID=E0IA26_9BACL|nr:EamA family transporter [Paenibacillus curdlanolyticus]EFM10603.1 protein of unknown function DUF6 transmembrane [Paenibacillus curdlanolyticus YK9]
MYSTAMLLVISSGFLHSIWNLYTKRSMNKTVFLWFTQLAALLIFLPWTIMAWPSNAISSTCWWLIAASLLLHALYIQLLAAVYSIGDLSQVYPIMRGTSPLLVPLLGVTLLHESLTAVGWLGVIIIVGGIASVSNLSLRSHGFTSLKTPLLALAVGICIAAYIVIDKLVLSEVPAVVLNESTNAGNLLVLSWAAFRSRGMTQELRSNWAIILLGGLLAPAGYLLFLFALKLAPVAQLAPIREIGTVFGTIMGIFILREQQGARRLFASMAITAGIIVLGVWG